VERTYNLLWQRATLRSARELQRRVGFDAIHHLTWAGVRAPTFWGRSDRLSSDRLAAGKHPPFSLRDGFGLRGRILETLRDLSNATITINPLVRGGLSRASIIFASTCDTRNLLPLEKKRLSSHHWESERSYWAHRVRGIKHHQGCFTLAGFSIGRGFTSPSRPSPSFWRKFRTRGGS